MRFFDRALVDGRSIRVRSTERSDGDFAVGGAAEGLEERRQGIVDRPWVWLHQVHGATCLDADRSEADLGQGTSADASVTTRNDVALSIQTADCLPIMMWSDDGVIAAAHVGWRGLEAGVIKSTVTSIRGKSDAPLHAYLGPSIGPECYEFGENDLNRLEEQFGAAVRSHTTSGTPALDVRAGALSELGRLGVNVAVDDDECTACSETFFSHRARAEHSRQTTVIWIEDQ